MDLDKILLELSSYEKKLLLTLDELGGSGSPEEILAKGGFKKLVEIMNASSWLRSKKLVEIKEDIKVKYYVDVEGEKFLKEGFPEKKALGFIIKQGGTTSLRDLGSVLDKNELTIAMGWLKRKRWVDIKKEGKEIFLYVTDEGRRALESETWDEKILRTIQQKPGVEVEKEKIKDLLSRKKVIKEKEVVTSIIFLNDNGRKILEKGLEFKEEISQITPSVIKKGEWKNKVIRPYDIYAFSPAKHGGKPHPLMILINQIRQIFLEMGFEEIEGDFVESCFWCMDVLFIPQDHPARDMQDTFYCKNPSRLKIEDENFLKKIAEIHENGGMTSSEGWGYKFSVDESKKTILRTHTTVNTIRYLYKNPLPPSKVFSIGRVFRKENIDATHLPEFYQIEGIIHEENTNFRQLIGVLKEFYRRMGFEKIRFRPAYFPYTEPSMEVEVLWDGSWMELGGSGIFRPEVTEPIGIKNPVLAWGLGLERLAMLKLGLTDMRNVYISDLGWLKNNPLIKKVD